MRALSTAATGMEAQSLAVEVISHNLANMNTIAFKRQRAEFEDLLYQTISQPGANSSNAGTIVPTGVQVGLGANAGSVYRITEQGGMSATNNPYDVATSGPGPFRVPLPDRNDASTPPGDLPLARFGLVEGDRGGIAGRVGGHGPSSIRPVIGRPPRPPRQGRARRDAAGALRERLFSGAVRR